MEVKYSGYLVYNIKHETAFFTYLAKAEELANTTSCASTKGSTEAQLFLSGITGEQTGRSTQAQSGAGQRDGNIWQSFRNNGLQKKGKGQIRHDHYCQWLQR